MYPIIRNNKPAKAVTGGVYPTIIPSMTCIFLVTVSPDLLHALQSMRFPLDEEIPHET